MLGLIGVAYGAAQLASTYGFLAVFAAGLALQRSQRQPGTSQAALQSASWRPEKRHRPIAAKKNSPPILSLPVPT